MRRLALGSAATIATLMCIPDAIGIIPVTPDALSWFIRITGLWLSAFILWAFGAITILYLARFIGGGILLTERGIKFSRFSKIVEWQNIKALTVDEQPVFAFVFGLSGGAKRLLVFEEKSNSAGGKSKLSPHPVPSFQFASEEFRSLFAHISQGSMHFVPHSIEVYLFPPEQSAFLHASANRTAKLRVILSVLIAIGLIAFLGRRASLNYHFNHGIANFRQENYVAATKDFEKATRIDQTFASAWDQLARSEFRSEDPEDAERHWHRALLMKPDLVEAKIGLSNIFMSRDENKKAESLLSQCAQLAPGNPAVYLNQAVLYQKLGQPKKVKDILAAMRGYSCDRYTLEKMAVIEKWLEQGNSAQ